MRVEHLTVDLAATLQSGPPLPSPTSREDAPPRTAHFRFRRTPAPFGVLNDIGSSEDLVADHLRARDRLAYGLAPRVPFLARSSRQRSVPVGT